VPNGTELRIRLSTPISTKTGRVGDTFRATVVSPSSYESSTIEGHIATLNKSGRVSGKTEVGLAFDSLTLPDGRQTRIDADLVKVYESENVKKVDEEGNVESGSRTRESEVRGGVGAAAGAIIGGILGGGKGAIIGLILGGAAGVGSVYVEGNKDLILEAGTEMVIRTVGAKDR
jgi:outer membrane lipoprotein SlyB